MDTLQTPTTNPEHSVSWHRHERGCKLYRERWFSADKHTHGNLLYQVFCGQDSPPVTNIEQQRCLCSTRICWRTGEKPISVSQENAENTYAKAS
jgi:hypothetical protein